MNKHHSKLEISSHRVNITPSKKTPLAGIGHRVGSYHKIDSDLEINGVRLVQNNIETFIISVDTLFLIIGLESIKELKNIKHIFFEN